MSAETSPLAARVTRSVAVSNRTVMPRASKECENRLAREVLGAAEDPPLAHDEGDLLAPERAPRIGHLAGNHAAPDDDETARDGLGAGGIPARPHAGGLDAWDGRDRRPAAGADRDRVAGGEGELGALRRGHDDPALAGQPSGAPGEIDVVGLEPLHLPVVLPVGGEAVTPAQHCGTVDGAGDRLTGAVDRERFAKRLTTPEQGLARHARPIGAVTADQLVLDHRAGQPALDGTTGNVLAGRPGADDDDVVLTVAIDQGHGCASSG